MSADQQTFSPMDPQFESRIRDSFARQGFLQTLGAEINTIHPGEVEISAPFDDRFTQQDGFLHAGVTTALVDTACGYAAYTLMPADSRVLSVEFKINFLSVAQGERFLARGRVVKAGRTLTVCAGELFAFEGDQRQRVAAMQATMICVQDKPSEGVTNG
ncbi:MAG: PaaI family thioesterase [Anaerolineales bacterium]|jgi:uncharacterized protein (TIGR00369 family)